MSGEVYLGLVSSILILTTQMQRTSFWEYARHQGTSPCHLGTSPCLQRANGSQTAHEKAHIALIFQMGSLPRVLLFGPFFLLSTVGRKENEPAERRAIRTLSFVQSAHTWHYLQLHTATSVSLEGTSESLFSSWSIFLWGQFKPPFFPAVINFT